MAAHRRLAVARCARVARYWLLVVGLCSLGTSALATTYTSDGSYADVLTQYNLTNPAGGDTITLPPGLFSWDNNTLEVTHPVTIQGAGMDATTVFSTILAPLSTSPSNKPVIYTHPAAPGSPGDYKILDITFKHASVGGVSSALTHEGGLGINGPHFIVGRCRFKNYWDGATAVAVGGQVRGVIYGCEFQDGNVPFRIFGYNSSDLSEFPRLISGSVVTPYPFAFGSSDSFFFEDNRTFWTFDFTYDPGSGPIALAQQPGWIESGQSSRIVARYNTWDFNHIVATSGFATSNIELWDVHGFQSWLVNRQPCTITVASPALLDANVFGLQDGQGVYLTTTGALPTGLSASTTYYTRDVVGGSGTFTFHLAATPGGPAIATSGTQSGTHTVNRPGFGQTGSMCSEFYGNTIAHYPSVVSSKVRGGINLVFNNVYTDATYATSIAMQFYGPNDNGGSGCVPEVEDVLSHTPGAAATPLQFRSDLYDTYAFNNSVNGSIVAMNRSLLGCPTPRNVDWFTDNAAFDGTKGAGPDGNGDYANGGVGKGTTAPSLSADVGMGYWVASDPTPTVDPAVIQSGHLYKRSGGTWVDYYHPFTYPHPWRSDAPDSAPTMPATDSATFTVGVSNTKTISRTGQPAPTFSETGALPSGVSLNSTTGVLSGTPAGGTEGIYSITITATNGISPDATQAFTLTVIVPPLLDVTETPGTGSFTHYSHATSTASGTYHLKFQNLISGDMSVLIDSVKIDGSLVTNGDFELPVETTWEYLASAPGWVFTTNGGVQANGSPWSSSLAAVDGTQTALIQNETGSATSTLSLSAGIHTVEYYMAQRTTGNSGDETVHVTLSLAVPNGSRRASSGFGW